MGTARGKERGFSLTEVLVAMAIMGILFAVFAQMMMVYAKQQAHIAAKARRAQAEQDIRRLANQVMSARLSQGFEAPFPSAGPWPAEVPCRNPVLWSRPAPGFDELGWAPSTSPTYLQFRVDGWATSFMISALGDIDRDGGLELYRYWGDVGMFEGPLSPGK